MLVITRRAGEAFLIGDDIEISLLEVSGDKVKLGIAAPKTVKVIRKELKETASLNRESACKKVNSAVFDQKLINYKK